MKEVLCLCVAMLIVGCQPTVNPRGNQILGEHIASLIVGKTTMSEVVQKCGTPSLHVDNFTWIYVGAVAEETSFSDVALKNRYTVKMEFDQNKVLKSITPIKQAKSDKVPMDKEISNLKTPKQISQKIKQLRNK